MIFSADGRTRVLFIKVPEPKQIKNRLHFDLRPVELTRDQEAERLIAHGATLVADGVARTVGLVHAGRPRRQRVLRAARRPRDGRPVRPLGHHHPAIRVAIGRGNSNDEVLEQVRALGAGREPSQAQLKAGTAGPTARKLDPAARAVRPCDRHRARASAPKASLDRAERLPEPSPRRPRCLWTVPASTAGQTRPCSSNSSSVFCLSQRKSTPVMILPSGSTISCSGFGLGTPSSANLNRLIHSPGLSLPPSRGIHRAPSSVDPGPYSTACTCRRSSPGLQPDGGSLIAGGDRLIHRQRPGQVQHCPGQRRDGNGVDLGKVLRPKLGTVRHARTRAPATTAAPVSGDVNSIQG